MIIEVDGEQHFENANYDASRSDALAALGYRVLRYSHLPLPLRGKGRGKSRRIPPQRPHLRLQQLRRGDAAIDRLAGNDIHMRA